MFFNRKIEKEVERSVIEKAISSFFKETIKEQVSSELVRQLVSEALQNERTAIDQKEKALVDESFYIKRQRLELEKIQSFGSISSVKLQEEMKKMEDKYHEHKRLSKNSYDDDDVAALTLKHTIDFIKKCIE